MNNPILIQVYKKILSLFIGKIEQRKRQGNKDKQGFNTKFQRSKLISNFFFNNKKLNTKLNISLIAILMR